VLSGRASEGDRVEAERRRVALHDHRGEFRRDQSSPKCRARETGAMRHEKIAACE